jgi:plasmid maintenance system antidote protein VapI
MGMMTETREFVPAEAFPVSVLLLEEMFERDWTRNEVARRMGGEFEVNVLTLDLIFAQRDLECGDGIRLGEETAAQLEAVFGISAEMWLRTDAAYRKWRKSVR